MTRCSVRADAVETQNQHLWKWIIVSDLCKTHYLIHFTAKKRKIFFHPLWISVELQNASLGSESMSRRSAACVIPCCLFISWLIAEVTLWDGHPNYLTVLKYPHWVPAVASQAQHTLAQEQRYRHASHRIAIFHRGWLQITVHSPSGHRFKNQKNIIFFKLKHHDVWSFYPNASCICICGCICVHQG